MAQSPSTIDLALAETAEHLSEALSTFDPLRFRMWCDMGLTTAQLRVMFLIRGQPGVTAGELATRLSVTPPTVSGIVDRLVKMDLVRREEDRSDRRLVRNHLTEAGEAACSRMKHGNQYFTRRILSELNEQEIADLNRGLMAFIRANAHVREIEPNLAETAYPG